MSDTYIPTGIFNLLSEDDILAIQAKAIQLIKEGKTIMTYTGEGNEWQKEFTMNPRDIMVECNYSLKYVNPDFYGRVVRRSKVYRPW